MAPARGFRSVPRGAFCFESIVLQIGFDSLETRSVTLGFIPLLDCAPLIVARDKGYFRKHGLDVLLLREPSWATLRDRVALGLLDGAHMLQALPLAITAGLGGLKVPVLTACVLNLGGNGITISTELWQELHAIDPAAAEDAVAAAKALATVIAERRARRLPPLTFAATFPYSSHNYELRLWLTAGGIDADRDVKLVVIPPQQMLSHLAGGRIDGYCVGAPWNSMAAVQGVGRVVCAKCDIWDSAPEKVFGVTRAWAERHPNAHRALLRALIEAGAWLDDPRNHGEAAALMGRPEIVNAPAALIEALLSGRLFVEFEKPARLLPDLIVFHRYAANFPWRSQALWTLTAMCRAGQINSDLDLRALAAQVVAPDTYRAAAAELGLPAPTIDDKTEGTHANGWTLHQATRPIAMGPDRILGGRVFDPARIDAEWLAATEDRPGARSISSLSKEQP
jgi:ABC-type nitrate/sulfonate/bicarbonate transport system substrate-binding protein